MIPLIMKLKIVEDNRTKINLPLPLFLVWILLFCLSLLLLPFILIAALALWILRNDLRLLTLFPKVVFILCALSGLVVQIEEKNKRVDLWVQ
jgi:hypothetical protein